MTNFRVASVDGFGDRDDIALERDKNQGQIKENQADERAIHHQALIDSCEYGTSSEAQNLSEIVEKMILTENYSQLLLKSHVIWDVDSISEAVTEACIRLGLSDEEFSPDLNDQGGNQVNIELF